ncbi:hypothetical protein B0A49_08752 [Cryomyces minteri]|uniref:Uncharacterized protein n=1 Tax=Cryomyces minteri TaxID=331657 RepID=A0A4U0WX32_9PEZI|nr:hypothetical protein B0A49_08752 [Cryomyces minteri]
MGPKHGSITRFSVYEEDDTIIHTPDSVYPSLLPELDADDTFSEDHAVASIEHDENTRRVSSTSTHDSHARHLRDSPRRPSNMTASEFSELPEEYEPEDEATTHQPYTPMKERPTFRNPSSVRAMQMISPPPFDHFSSPRSAPRYKLSTPSRNGTPRSTRSHSVIKQPRPLPRTQSTRKEHPLVLLHVTLLPILSPYSMSSMQAVLPPHIIDNYNVLRAKTSDTVLQRGILIPHPRAEYELLEERLLESLELRVPRILKCGHFHRPSTSPYGPGSACGDDDDDSDTLHESCSEDGHIDTDTDADPDLCATCNGRVKDGRHGTGAGTKRWELRIYAANGLMRAGAWAAAWSEMERVDVEIGPWIPEELRRELDERRAEEDEEAGRAMELERQLAREERRREERDRERAREGAAVPSTWTRSLAASLERAASPSPVYTAPRAPSPPQTQAAPPRPPPEPPAPILPSKPRAASPLPSAFRRDEVPLTVLLRNYVYLLTRNRRNVALFALSLGAAFLAASPWSGARASAQSSALGGGVSAPTQPRAPFPQPSDARSAPQAGAGAPGFPADGVTEALLAAATGAGSSASATGVVTTTVYGCYEHCPLVGLWAASSTTSSTTTTTTTTAVAAAVFNVQKAVTSPAATERSDAAFEDAMEMRLGGGLGA